ncbi:hypothetical protein [Rhizobium sp. CFBP 13726]|uniref:hypothetical protein n=1 Tax=Rhizobium sp. CFBP 13726 TaxID=2775296 RepID=UPI002017581E|nr:hypothetical protein [Rhizobium sp. CFBP 13726]
MGLIVTGCQRPSEGVYFELSGRIFVFNYRVATANYLVTLRKVSATPKESRARAEFENPRGGPPLVTEERVLDVDDALTLASPFVQCVRKDRPYRVTITLTGTSGEVLQVIETTVTSDVDQSVIPAAPLVVGPVYSPNPDVFKADGSSDFSGRTGCPVTP